MRDCENLGTLGRNFAVEYLLSRNNRLVTIMTTPTERRTIQDTWALLDADGLRMPRDATGAPFIPAGMPNHDNEEPLGLSYFRSGLIDADLHALTLPRTFFGRSSFERVNFRNSG